MQQVKPIAADLTPGPSPKERGEKQRSGKSPLLWERGFRGEV
jgi:hypothetical protein